MAAAKQLNFQVMRINHKEKVTEALESMFLDESLTDVTICCCGQQVKAHRVILAASSNYFKEIFAATLPGQYPIVFIKSITIEDLNAILEFIYKGEVTVPREQMQSLVSSAECLGVSGLGNMDLDDPNLNSGRPIRPEHTLVNGSSTASSPSRSDVNLDNDGQKNDGSKAAAAANLTMQKKRGKKRKIVEEEQNQKVTKTTSSKKTNGHSNGNGVNSSSPQSTSSSSSTSTSTRKSAQPQQASTSITNGHHKVASVSSRAGAASEPMDEAEDEATDEENIKEESSSSARTRKNSMTLKIKSKRMNGYRTRGESVVQEQHPSRNSTPSLDSDVEIEISGRYGSKMDEQHRTSNGSLDLSRKSTSLKSAADSDTPLSSSKESSSTSSGRPVKTVVTKSKLRSWSQQISQSAGPMVEQQQTPPPSSMPSGLKGLGLPKHIPQLNLTAIKNEISGQLAASGLNSPSTSNGASPTVFNAKAMTPTSNEDEKPVITIPPHIKMEARPRGRPRKAITEKAAIVPRPLNPLLGIARSSISAKVAKAAASANASKESPAEPTSIDRSSTSAPATPVAAASCTTSVSGSVPSTPSSEVEVNDQSTITSESTPTVPVMRVSRISPSTSHTVTIVNGSGDIVSTVTAGGSSSTLSSSPHSPALSSASSSSFQSVDLNVEQTSVMTTAGGSSTTSTSNSFPVVKKRRGRPPSIGNLANLKQLNIQPKQEPRVPSLTLKIPNKFASIFKSSLNASANSAPSTSKPLHQSVMTSFFGGGNASSTPIYTSSTSSASIPPSSNNPSSSAHAPAQPRPSSAQSMATISSGSLPAHGGHEFPVPRFTPIVASGSAAAVASSDAAKESSEKSSEQATPEAVAN